MYEIEKKEFLRLKKELKEWLYKAFENDDNSYSSNGLLWKHAQEDFCFPINGISIKISASFDNDTGHIVKTYFDDIEIIDEHNNTHYRSYINDDQIEELNTIIKHND
jgi:hypothetical protein